MAGVNFNGLGSGIDFSQLTESILAERSRPITQLQNKSAGISQRADALKSLNGLLASLTGAADALKNRDIGTARAVATTDSSVATASATSAAVIAKTDLNVTRLATNFTQTSRSFAAKTDAVLAGAATTATFELRKGGAITGPAITINSTNNSLDGLSQAINSANAGITASVVDITGAGSFQLVLQSTATGTASRVELVETTAPDTGTVTGLNLTRINAPGGTPLGDFSYLDSQVSLNGLSITRSTNQISDAITGVTYNLQKVGATSVNVISASDLPVKLQGFVDAYNAVQDFMLSQYKKDGKGKPSGVLAGDPTLRSIQNQLREAVGGATTTAATGSTLSNLAQIGVGRDNDGRLTLSRVVLDERLKAGTDDVRALLAGASGTQTGLANSIYTLMNGLSDTVNGVVQTAIAGYQQSIKNIDKSITAQFDRLNLLRQSLTRQFAVADAAIGQLNGQGTTLDGIIKSLQPRSN